MRNSTTWYWRYWWIILRWHEEQCPPSSSTKHFVTLCRTSCAVLLCLMLFLTNTVIYWCFCAMMYEIYWCSRTRKYWCPHAMRSWKWLFLRFDLLTFLCSSVLVFLYYDVLIGHSGPFNPWIETDGDASPPRHLLNKAEPAASHHIVLDNHRPSQDPQIYELLCPPTTNLVYRLFWSWSFRWAGRRCPNLSNFLSCVTKHHSEIRILWGADFTLVLLVGTLYIIH